MLDFADVVAINKFERRGAEDALRDVGRQLVRNREAFGKRPEEMPVFGTSRGHASTTTASPRSTSTCAACSPSAGCRVEDGVLPAVDVRHSTGIRQVVPTDRVRYLAEITETVRGYHAQTERLAEAARRVQRLEIVQGELVAADQRHRRRRGAAERRPPGAAARGRRPDRGLARGRGVLLRRRAGRDGPRPRDPHRADPRVAVGQQDPAASRCPGTPTTASWCASCARENLPGYFPFTAGVFPFKRDGEDPARMFAGEGDPFRTNRRFKLLSDGQRGDPPVDRVRLGHALRPRPRPAPRRLRQGRHLRGLDRHAGRHEGALRRLRPRLARPRRCR